MVRSELPHESIDRTLEWVSSMIESAQNGTTDFIITSKEDDKAIGKMGIWQNEEIGFLLNAKYWRKRLAQEALDALIPYFFNEMGFENITADIDPDNRACLGLLKKLGFEVTGFEEKTFKLGERWVDSCYLSLRKKQWERLANGATT